MLGTLLDLKRPLVVPDVETTGLDKLARIVELGFQIYQPDGRVDEWRSYINPEIPIQPLATKTHGITDEMLTNCNICGRHMADHPGPFSCTNVSTGGSHFGESDPCASCGMPSHAFQPIPIFAQLAPQLAIDFSGCDFAGKSVRFDLEVMVREFKRVGIAWSFKDARVLCADAFERILEPRDLSSMYRRKTRKEPQGAHGVRGDVRMTVEVLASQLAQIGVRDLATLHEQQWSDWIDTEGKFRFVETFPVMFFGKHRGLEMREVPRGYWLFIRRSNFTTEIKQIAAAAMRGEFPVRKEQVDG